MEMRDAQKPSQTPLLTYASSFSNKEVKDHVSAL